MAIFSVSDCFSSLSLHSVDFPSFKPLKSQYSPTKLAFWDLLVLCLHFYSI